MPMHLRALGANARRRRLDLLRRARDDRHRRAGLRQPRCDLQVDAARRAGNERGLARQKVVAETASWLALLDLLTAKPSRACRK